MQRIFVTSVGVISCAGSGADDYWEGINLFRGIRPDSINLPIDIPQNIDNRIIRRMDRFSRLTLSCSKQVMDKFLELKAADVARIGTVFTTGYGPLNSNLLFCRQLQSGGVDLVSPTVFTSTVYNSGIGHTCLNLKLKGVSTLLMGSNALAYASDLLKSGKADAILCGGVEEYSQELDDCYRQQGYTFQDDEFLCRPLDSNRGGTKVTEGAGTLLLENENVLTRNPESILCEIVGYASVTSPVFPGNDNMMTEPDTFAKVMRLALNHASIRSEDIDGILMAAPGGQRSDKSEAQSIHETFGDRAAFIPSASIKGAIGETIGASFTLNAVAASLALSKNCMPLTVGCLEPDADLRLDIVHHKPRHGNYRYLMVNGYDVSGCFYSAILGSIWR